MINTETQGISMINTETQGISMINHIIRNETLTVNKQSVGVGGGSLQNRLGVVDCVDYGVVDSVDTQKKDYTKQNLQKNTPPTPPQNQREADASGAVACQSLKSKSKKEPPPFSALVIEVANKMLDLLKKYTPVYRPPSDLNKFLLHVSVGGRNE